MPTAGPLDARVRAHRRRTGLTQSGLAAAAGISVRALRDIERGHVRRPQLRTLCGLAAVLGLDVEEIRRPLAPQRAPAEDDRTGLRIGVLGSLSIELDGVEREMRALKLRRLLALLVLCHPYPAGLDEIAGTLWQEKRPRSYRNLIHTYVSQARTFFRSATSGSGSGNTSYLVRTPTGYALSVGRERVDLTRFEDLAEQARQAHARGEEQAAFEFAALAQQGWRGPVLSAEPQLAEHPAAIAANRRRIENLLLYADLALKFEQPRLVLSALRAAAEDEPLHEGVQARLVLALASCGEQAEALRVFSTVTRRLDNDLGLRPGPEMRHAQLQVLQQRLAWPKSALISTDPLPTSQPLDSSARLHIRPSQLPSRPRHFVGRIPLIRELDQVLLASGARAGQVPAALLTGPPGGGKTALALRWAHRAVEHFPDGQLYLDLRGHARTRPLTAQEALTRALRALGVSDRGIPQTLDEAESLYRTKLSGQRVLVVLDNARDEDQVRPLVPSGAGCAVLVTSRNTLPGLVARDGVRRITVDVLDHEEAMLLLTELLGPQRIGAEPLAAGALCRYCRGLPLVIRTYAAHLAQHPRLGINQYCEELRDNGIFQQRPTEPEDQLHATVRAAFELSYLALPAPTRRVFRLLGALGRGTVTDDTVARAAGLSPPQARIALHRLAEASLLREHTHCRFSLSAPLLWYAQSVRDQGQQRLPTT
ncbi:BTAD domain-containing putative transcriptional regulator [Streptomyces sp. NPDC004111]|uniref:BTAD domain-containing putative transcriptional regulator n=1 Tax=Streptomyces sp. NPDC004111 TaxID=3364690 RepID=UPI0036CF3364